MTPQRTLLVVAAAIVALAAAGLLFAVDSTEVPERPDRDPLNPAKIPVLPDNLDTFEHVNTLVVPDPDSPIHGIHHFYANHRAAAALEAGGSDEYPTEAIFVGKVFKPVKTDEGWYTEGDLVAYTLMEKDPVDVAARVTGGWHFVMYDAEGASKGVDPVEACFGCHEPSPETDFVLSTALE